jgi:hypothetical protein
MITKKQTLLVSIIGVVVFTIISTLSEHYGCKEDLFFFCRDAYSWFVYILHYIPVSILAVSLLTYKMKDSIYYAWLKFAYVWVPLTIILTILAPEYDSSFVPLTKGAVSFLMSLAFLIISLILIIVKYIRTKTTKTL